MGYLARHGYDSKQSEQQRMVALDKAIEVHGVSNVAFALEAQERSKFASKRHNLKVLEQDRLRIKKQYGDSENRLMSAQEYSKMYRKEIEQE